MPRRMLGVLSIGFQWATEWKRDVREDCDSHGERILAKEFCGFGFELCGIGYEGGVSVGEVPWVFGLGMRRGRSRESGEAMVEYGRNWRTLMKQETWR